MKISCNQTEITEAVLKVQRAVSTKSNIPALEGILIKTINKNQIELCGYNLELGIQTTIFAEVESSGSIVLNAKLFSDIVRKLPKGKVNIEMDTNLFTNITCENSEFSIIGIQANDYPELPKFNESQKILLSSTTLKSMIKQTIFAIAETDAKPVHTGTLFDIEKREITLVSVDGYKFAKRKEKIDLELRASFVVPGKTLNEILKILPDEEEEILIYIGEKHITFKIKECSVISRLLEGDFLDYKAAIPIEKSTEVRVKTKELISSLERVSLLITDKFKSPVCCLFSDNSISLSCVTAIGKGLDFLPATVDGKKLEVGFNSKYLLDALRNTETDEIKIEMNGNLSPMKIIPIEGDGFLFLVLPVRLSANS